MQKLNRLLLAMAEHDKGHPQLIQHFIKVHQFARLIGACEGLDAQQLYALEAAAIVHDIGILPSLAHYGDDSGPHQEELGPVQAESMLHSLDFSEDAIARVCWLVAHHHTYANIDSTDYRILVEADFLVNLFENHAGPEAVARARNNIFVTKTGLALLDAQFPTPTNKGVTP